MTAWWVLVTILDFALLGVAFWLTQRAERHMRQAEDRVKEAKAWHAQARAALNAAEATLHSARRRNLFQPLTRPAGWSNN